MLALVVGPSGAGKDTLIMKAQEQLSGDPRFTFPRRIVTRAADVSLEDHETVAPEQFQQQKQRGQFALDWDAHGLRYALPATIDAAIVAGRIVVANASRRIVAKAVGKYVHCRVLLVTAEPAVRGERLRARGRESADEIEARLEREEPPLPAAVMPVVIDNSGALEAGVRRFVNELRRLAE